MAVVYVEGDDAQAGVARFAASDAPLNRWFRDQMKEVHGVDISQAELRVRQVHDVQV